MAKLTSLLRPTPLFLIAALLRVVLLLYGIHQDANSALKYTDIDYLVFTDAARTVSEGRSPYARDTYRYTPLLAWMLLPTATRGSSSSSAVSLAFFSFGKVVFAAADLWAGWLILGMLRRRTDLGGSGSGSGRSSSSGGIARGGLSRVEREGAFAALWLWNPMVATISTRGSSEGLLGVLTMGLLWAVERRRVALAGVVLGVAVHFKIYPFIYAPAIIWWMDEERIHPGRVQSKKEQRTLLGKMMGFLSKERVTLAVTSLVTFMGLNVLMFLVYGTPFLVHTYFHHVTRLDHRHNFSPYNTLLYLTSAEPTASSSQSLHAESLAFLPQLLLSCVLIPLVVAKRDLATSMMAQTFAFVTFNKVCTSQYFLWYMVFLPLYLPTSSMLRTPRLGIAALLLWVITQAAWLQQGYELEFLGRSTFFPGLWLSSILFFLVNCWILGIVISDGATAGAKVLGQAKQHTE